MLKFIFSVTFLHSAIIFAMPLIFASMAALISNKAGILNINIEGSMSITALTGALVSHFTGSWVIGMLAAMLSGIIMSLILAYCSLLLRTDSTLAGIALNTFTTGFCILILYMVLGVKGDSSQAPSVMVPDLKLPVLSRIPVLGKVIFEQNFMVYLGIVCVILVSILLNRSRLGIRIKATGYNPAAAKAAGINTDRYKAYSLMICGALTGLGGAFLSMVYLSYFSVGVVAGKGFIGLAAEAMGGGVPVLTALFAVLFGAVDYFAVGAQSVLQIPYQLLNTLPYIMTMLALIIYSVKSNAQNRKTLKKETLEYEKSMGA